MPYDPRRHNRQSMRLPDYDYAQPGAYFVTICTADRAHLFGHISEGVMRCNDIGQIVEDEWKRTPEVRSNVKLDAYVVMPNHVHGIVVITHRMVPRGESQFAPGERKFESPSHTVGAIVRGFKGAATRRINVHRGTPGQSVWQRNYHVRIIRAQRALYRIRRYIKNNPAQWPRDRNR